MRTSTLLALALVAGACRPTPETPPSAVWTAESVDGRFVATLRPQGERPQIGRVQNWEVKVTTPEGKAVYPARIGVNGGMPGHGHGLPTTPQVTEHLGEGRYRIEGLSFNMAGDWVLLLAIETPELRDRVQFEMTIDW